MAKRTKRQTPTDPQEIVSLAVAERIWPRCVKAPSGCWLWTGANNALGYGRIGLAGKTVGVHRVVLAHKLGRAIGDGLDALHSCDVRACCNPEHLREGTDADNTHDKVSRHRQPAGETHYAAKLTGAQAVTLRRRYVAGGITHQRLADEYGVSRSTVTEILSGKRYTKAGSVHA